MYGSLLSLEQELLGDSYCEANELHDPDNDDVLDTGLRALISATGSTDVLNPSGHLTLTCDYMPIHQPGIFYLGTNAISIPFGDVGGLRCVGGGTARLGVRWSGAAGSPDARRMVLTIDYANPPSGFNISDIVGRQKRFQCWFRDAPGLSGHFNLSDALSIQF
jgi:hypothetical protein